MSQIRTVIRAAGVILLLALPQVSQAGVYYTVEARYSDDRDTWKDEGSWIIEGKKPTALADAKKRVKEVYEKLNVLEVRITRTSDAAGSKPVMLWSSGGGKLGAVPELPEKDTGTDAPPRGKKQIIVRVYKRGKGEEKGREYRTNSNYDAAVAYYKKMKGTPGYMATWTGPGWDKPKITLPEERWVDLNDTYNPPKKEYAPKNSLVGTKWQRKPSFSSNGTKVVFYSKTKVRFTPIFLKGQDTGVVKEREVDWSQKEDGSYVIEGEKGRYKVGQKELTINGTTYTLLESE